LFHPSKVFFFFYVLERSCYNGPVLSFDHRRESQISPTWAGREDGLLGGLGQTPVLFVEWHRCTAHLTDGVALVSQKQDGVAIYSSDTLQANNEVGAVRHLTPVLGTSI
jgi:hypothetical protein